MQCKFNLHHLSVPSYSSHGFYMVLLWILPGLALLKAHFYFLGLFFLLLTSDSPSFRLPTGQSTLLIGGMYGVSL